MSEMLLTTEEVAQRLRVSDQTILSYLKSGHLRGIRLGRVWRVRPADLETFLDARSNDALWRKQFEELLARVRSRIPAHITEDEIEGDAEAAVAEVRQLGHARRR